ncbi:MAG: hypothetical protein ACTHMT_15605 [Verrucomicrobiota bacterium]
MNQIAKLSFLAGCLTLALSSSNLLAVTVYPGDPSWANPPGENGGGGSAAITTTAPRSGNGSVEMFGDRTRFFGLGNPYSSASNIGLLSDIQSFTFDWSVATDSISKLGADYTPALRLHIWDGAQRSELIWEGAYNGVSGLTKGAWYTTGTDDNFWQYKAGIGDSLIYNNDISDWQSVYSKDAYIAGISVGLGSSVGSDYHAFADNVTLTFKNGQSATYNFEVAAPDGGSTLALLSLASLGVVSFTRKFKKA